MNFNADHLIGIRLPTNIAGHAGREVENIIESMGISVNRRFGIDCPEIDIEIKTRKLSATSPQTMASMLPDYIINNSYKNSILYQKMKRQLRIYTNDLDVIVKAEIFNFDIPEIQDLLEEAYEHGRKIITRRPNIGYTPYEGFFGYFEQTKSNTNAYDFRVTNNIIKTLEQMTKSNFKHIFEVYA